jgi:hypothetical protein
MCPTCLTQTCTRCGDEPHIEWKCEEYELVKHNLGLMAYYEMKGNHRPCPKFGNHIENPNENCYVQCPGCHVHIWWQYMATFTLNAERYRHMDLVRRGLIDQD